MDRMLVVVFDNETKAYEGKKALQQLDAEGSIGVLLLRRGGKECGRQFVAEAGRRRTAGTLVGTSLGSLVGALFGSGRVGDWRDCRNECRHKGTQLEPVAR